MIVYFILQAICFNGVAGVYGRAEPVVQGLQVAGGDLPGGGEGDAVAGVGVGGEKMSVRTPEEWRSDSTGQGLRRPVRLWRVFAD